MELVEQFATFLNLQNKPPSSLTVKNYKSDVRHFIRWFEKELHNSFSSGNVTPQIIELYKKSKGISARSIDRHLSSLRKFFSFAKQEGLILTNPFDLLLASSSPLPANEDSWKLKDFKNYLYIHNASSLTIKNYINDIEQFFSWLEKVTGIENAWHVREKNLFDKIDLALFEEYKHRLLKTGFSARSINRKLSSLRKYMRWAKNEGLVGQTNWHTPSSTPAEVKIFPQYSRFPPLRLWQKTINGINILFDELFIVPLAGVIRGTQNFLWKFKGRALFKDFSNNNFRTALAIKNISNINFPWHRKMLRYFHLGIFAAAAPLFAVFLYQQVFEEAQKEAVLGVSNKLFSQRTLFFQGRLADVRNIAVTKSTDVRFSLYSDQTTPSPLWEEIQYINPDKDGTFIVSLGTNEPISQQIFNENPSLYLGITIKNSPELVPRQQIATTVYAAKADTLQGLPPITQAGALQQNVVLALDSSGNLSIGGNASPTFQATGGDFTLSGQSLILSTTPGSNGDVLIAPDGSGNVDIQKPIHNTSEGNSITGVSGAVEIADLLSILATSSGQSAFTINQNSTGPIVSASSSGTAKFTLENDGTTYIAGNVGIGTKNPIAKLQVSGDIAPTENGKYNLGSPSLRFDTLYANTIIASSSGTLAYWQRTEGVLSPTTITDTLNLGASATSSATVHLSGTDQSSFIQKGNFGVGTNNPVAKLHVQGDQYVSGNVGIGTSNPNYKLDVTGSINATGDIYKNGGAFNNPDYVLEKWATGNIALNAQKKGASTYGSIMSLEDIETFAKTYFQLPGVASANGIFERGDILLEKVEEAYIHLFDLNRKISSLIDTAVTSIETLTTKKIISPIAQIDQLHTNIVSPLSSDSVVVEGKLIVQELLTENATVSGTLRAKKIIAEQIDGLTQNVTNVTNIYEATPSAAFNPVDIASYSAQAAFDFGKFTQGLIALGPASFTDVSVTGNLTVGNYLRINDTSLNVIGADLEIQPLKQGGVSFLSGLIQIDIEGNLTVFGKAHFDKDVAILGDLIASGSATFKKLHFDGIKEAIAISDIEVTASSSAGVATISAQQSTLTINNPLVTDQSLIYITPREQTDNQVLYLLRQVPKSSFTVGIQKPVQKDVPFNWLIVN